MKKVLIVEDEKILREAIKVALSKEGYEILEAHNGEIGLELAINEKPDLILLDIIMPVMDGIDMLKQLRKKENGSHVPVIILTNLSETEKTAESLEMGVYDYLVKSDWKIDDVVAKVRERLGA